MDFSQVERFAPHFDSEEREGWQRPREVIKALALAKGHRVADVGAGTGYFVRYLAEAVGANGSVLALDVEPNMVRYVEARARENGWANVRARVIAANDPGLSPASVDRVLIVNTWHHIGDRRAYAAKLARALKPGGAIVVVDFTRESDIGPPADHRLAAEMVVQELSVENLNVTVLPEELPKQYIVRAARPK